MKPIPPLAALPSRQRPASQPRSSTPRSRRPHITRRPRARSALASVAAAGVVLLAAACGGATGGHVAQLRSTKPGSRSSKVAVVSVRQGGALAFARCMRAHGVLRFPDPGSGGVIPKVAPDRLGVSSSRFQSAQRACQYLLPNGGKGSDQAQLQRSRAQALRFSRCMRAHGVPSFPDPDNTGRIPDPASLHPPLDQGARRFQVATRACGASRPADFPSNAAYTTWAKTNG